MFGLGRIKLFRAFGITVEAHWTLLIALLLFSWSSSLALALMVFASVLVHEFGHSLVAQRLGVAIAGIELHFFGGIAKMVSLPKRPRDEILIAAAGPLTSLLLSALGFGLYALTGMSLAIELGAVNLMLAVFNMLPALPMDGGRIFRAALQTKLGGLKATRIAAYVARGLAVLMGVYGLVAGQVFLPVLAVLLWIMSGQELAFAELRYGRPQPRGPEVLPPEGGPVDPRQAQAAYRRMVSEMLAQVAARSTQQPGGPRRVVMRDSAGRVVIIEEGVSRW